MLVIELDDAPHSSRDHILERVLARQSWTRLHAESDALEESRTLCIFSRKPHHQTATRQHPLSVRDDRQIPPAALSASRQTTMASAVDIITYVGVPLAVLGVLPTIYTCFKSLLTLRSIRRSLDENGVAAITRSSLLSGIIEIEIPRKSIIPLDRLDPPYFELSHTPSHLRGGTWTIFNWKEMVIGVKAYRLQYHDELIQPQAEAEFEQLIAFLLDRGAVPSVAGFKDLRSSGLWTPAGTKLLLSPMTSEAALMVSTPDDSDGILSLCVNWRPEWDKRNIDSLPPYWMRVAASEYLPSVIKALKGEALPESEQEELQEVEDEKSELRSEDERLGTPYYPTSSAIRVRISSTGVEEAHSEHAPKSRILAQHLASYSHENRTCTWFASACTALGAPKGGLWSYVIPDDIRLLVRRDIMPCGVMVLLGIMTDEQVPTWRTEFDTRQEELDRQIKMQERSMAMMAEARLPPDQRNAAVKARMQKEAQDFHNDHKRRVLLEDQRREQTLTEAMTSQRLSFTVVGEACRKWLVAQNIVPETVSAATIVEQVLFCMIESPQLAVRMSNMLDLWRSWLDNGGMPKNQFHELKDEVTMFAFSTLIIASIKEACSDATVNVVSDLQECIRMWRKIRLG